jgi:hypothetical protein
VEIKNKATEKERRLAINCLTQCTVVVRVETAVASNPPHYRHRHQCRQAAATTVVKKDSKQASNSREERSR